MANAYAVAKHPTLPVLYVGCYGATNSKNLVTFQLNADGSIIQDSKRVCDDYFSPDGKTPSFPHQLRRPTVNPDKRILYLAAYPIVANSSMTYSDTNNFEFAAMALDEAGLPAKRLKLFRTDQTGTQGLYSIRYEPTLHRLFFHYGGSTHWGDLGNDGLPISPQTRYWVNLYYFCKWEYVPEWQRFFAIRASPVVAIFKLAADGVQPDFAQQVATCQGNSYPGYFEVSPKLHKIYVLDTVPERELIVHQLTAEGRLTSLPRTFNIGPATLIRCDSKSSLLYVFKDTLRTFKLDADGYPSGAPQDSPLSCGEVNDVLMDESNGKIYTACTRLPGLIP